MSRPRSVEIYDTTLRDGLQAENFNLSVEDKVKIALRLDRLGVHYVEGGWPGSNVKDREFFELIKDHRLTNSTITAFGATHNPKLTPETDRNLSAIIDSGCRIATLVGKSWTEQVATALGTTLERNLEMISGSVGLLAARLKGVFFDAEHFFDGYKADKDYALATLEAAVEAGASRVVLCDTNGGSLPAEVAAIVADVVGRFESVVVGIHTHNDAELAVANTLAAVEAGAGHVQGTINGYGERCGNANLCSVIPNLALKLGVECLDPERLAELTETARLVNELANLPSNRYQPYVGLSAFAHKAGIHVSAVEKASHLYEHVSPETVGNDRRILISDLAGQANIINRMRHYGLEVSPDDPVVKEIVAEVKELENQGYLFEAAEASFLLMVRRALGLHKPYFELLGFRVFDYKYAEDKTPVSEASIMVEVGGQVEHTAAAGEGPVNALDKAIRKALVRFYPSLEEMSLIDFKVRVLPGIPGTAAKVRVLIESGDNQERWGTVGVSQDVIQASWRALVDAIDYKLYKDEQSSAGEG